MRALSINRCAHLASLLYSPVLTALTVHTGEHPLTTLTTRQLSDQHNAPHMLRVLTHSHTDLYVQDQAPLLCVLGTEYSSTVTVD